MGTNFNDLWNNPDFVAESEKDEINLKVSSINKNYHHILEGVHQLETGHTHQLNNEELENMLKLHKDILAAAAEPLDECVPLEDVEW